MLRGVIRQLLAALPAERPLTLVDVGAMGGLEPDWAWLKDEGLLKTVGFEPDEREFAALRSDERTVFHPCALSSEAGRSLELHVAREPGKTSLFVPNMELVRRFPKPERFETVRSITLPAERVKTLDEMVPAADFIKLDTQGSELSILRGGEKLLKGVSGLKVEVEFLELYRGQPLFAEVDAFLRGRGFELADLRRVYWKRAEFTAFPGKGQLVFGDALYFKSADAVMDKEKTLKFAAVCLLYGMRDLAAAVCRKAGLADFDRDILASAPLHGLRVPGRNRLIRWMRELSRCIGRSDQGFADADAGLGNGGRP
jgi:FkbM family methyltransferase